MMCGRAGLRLQKSWYVVGWAALLATCLGLTMLLHAVASLPIKASVASSAMSAPPPQLSLVTATLVDGDDVRARFVTSLLGQPSSPPAAGKW
jgi:hypothetical protein